MQIERKIENSAFCMMISKEKLKSQNQSYQQYTKDCIRICLDAIYMDVNIITKMAAS